MKDEGRTRPVIIDTPDDLFRLGIDSVNYKELGLGEFMFPSPNEQIFQDRPGAQNPHLNSTDSCSPVNTDLSIDLSTVSCSHVNTIVCTDLCPPVSTDLPLDLCSPENTKLPTDPCSPVITNPSTDSCSHLNSNLFDVLTDHNYVLSQHSLRWYVLNVCGFKPKIKCPDFQKEIQYNDFVILTETKLDDIDVDNISKKLSDLGYFIFTKNRSHC